MYCAARSEADPPQRPTAPPLAVACRLVTGGGGVGQGISAAREQWGESNGKGGGEALSQLQTA